MGVLSIATFQAIKPDHRSAEGTPARLFRATPVPDAARHTAPTEAHLTAPGLPASRLPTPSTPAPAAPRQAITATIVSELSGRRGASISYAGYKDLLETWVFSPACSYLSDHHQHNVTGVISHVNDVTDDGQEADDDDAVDSDDSEEREGFSDGSDEQAGPETFCSCASVPRQDSVSSCSSVMSKGTNMPVTQHIAASGVPQNAAGRSDEQCLAEGPGPASAARNDTTACIGEVTATPDTPISCRASVARRDHIAGPGAHEPESMFVDHDPTSPVENHEAGSPEHDAEHIPDLDVSATSHLAPDGKHDKQGGKEAASSHEKDDVDEGDASGDEHDEKERDDENDEDENDEGDNQEGEHDEQEDKADNHDKKAEIKQKEIVYSSMFCG